MRLLREAWVVLVLNGALLACRSEEERPSGADGAGGGATTQTSSGTGASGAAGAAGAPTDTSDVTNGVTNGVTSGGNDPTPEPQEECDDTSPFTYSRRLNPVLTGPAKRLRLVENRLIVGWEGILDRGVSMLDVDSAEPRELGFIPGASVFDIASDLLAMKLGPSVELFSFDADGTFEPLGSWSSGATNAASGDDVQIVGDRVFVTLSDFMAESTELVILDISDPTSPRLESTFPTGRWSNGLVVQDDVAIAFGADDAPIVLVDVSDPSAPVELARITDAGPSVQSVALSGDLLIVSRGLEDLWVYDISDVESPVHTLAIAPDTDYVRKLLVQDEVLHILSRDEVRSVDIADPSAPVPLGSVRGAELITDLAVGQGNMFVADENVYEVGAGSCRSEVPAADCEILGDVLVNPNAEPGPADGYTVFSAEDLRGVKCISGFLEVRFTSSLESLSSLETVGELNINSNAELTTLAGLERLERLGSGLTLGSISISKNDILQNISALSAIKHVPGGLYIYENPALESLEGLEGLRSVAEGHTSAYTISITTNSVLADVSALNPDLFRGEEINARDNPLLNDCGLRELAEKFGVACDCDANLPSSCP